VNLNILQTPYTGPNAKSAIVSLRQSSPPFHEQAFGLSMLAVLNPGPAQREAAGHKPGGASR
jgi:hypothetical protein